MAAPATTATTVPPPAAVPRSLLRGHTATVLCLAASGPTGGDAAAAASASASASSALLLSGSEDGSARLWDSRTRRSTRCIKAFGGRAVTAVAFHTAREFEVMAACDREVHTFDLRANCDIVVRAALHPAVAHSADEINALSVHHQGAFIAAADDSGEVQILRTEQKGAPLAKHKTLKGKHTSLCTNVLFRPKCTWEVWSGGMDCQVLCWDFSTGRVVQTFSTQVPAAATSSNQTLNPPFVNSMAFTRDGEHLLAASGNAEILLFDARRKVERRRLTGHTHSVMHVGLVPLPPSFSSRGSFTSSTCLLSAGNDQTLLLWDLQAMIDTPVVVTPAAPATPASAAAAKNRRKKEKARAKKASLKADAAADAPDEDADDDLDETAVSAVDSLSLDSAASAAVPFTGSLVSSSSLPASLAFSALEASALDVSFIRYRWKHPAKMNALVSVAGAREAAAIDIFVADTTNDITAYHLQ